MYLFLMRICVKPFYNGIDNLYSLAEYFEVTEEYMRNCIQFYQNKYGEILYA